MQHWLDKLTDITALRGDEDGLDKALTHLASQAGFSGYAYMYLRPGHMTASSNYPSEWRAIYLKQKFDAVDPVVHRAKSMKRALRGVQRRKGGACQKRGERSWTRQRLWNPLWNHYTNSSSLWLHFHVHASLR